MSFDSIFDKFCTYNKRIGTGIIMIYIWNKSKLLLNEKICEH